MDSANTKFCKYCGASIPTDAVVCTACGRQVENVGGANPPPQPQVIINNENTNVNSTGRKVCNKWTSFLLCFFLGCFGAHKFYEGKIGMGILYIFTVGLFGIGVLIDLITILCKPNPYVV